jgi:hypothetical protein
MTIAPIAYRSNSLLHTYLTSIIRGVRKHYTLIVCTGKELACTGVRHGLFHVLFPCSLIHLYSMGTGVEQCLLVYAILLYTIYDVNHCTL